MRDTSVDWLLYWSHVIYVNSLLAYKAPNQIIYELFAAGWTNLGEVVGGIYVRDLKINVI